MSGKCFRMSEVSRGLKKCTDARMVQGGSEGSEGHKFQKPGRCRKVTRKNSVR